MRRIFIMSALLVCLFSCENMRDNNGDLGGMWQLLEWRSAEDEVKATNEDGIYYHFQLKLMRVQRLGKHAYLARFTHTNDSLIVGEVYSQPFDSIVSIDELLEDGVPADGIFHIDALSDSHMILSSEEGTMKFRKY